MLRFRMTSVGIPIAPADAQFTNAMKGRVSTRARAGGERDSDA